MGSSKPPVARGLVGLNKKRLSIKQKHIKSSNQNNEHIFSTSIFLFEAWGLSGGFRDHEN